MTFFFMVEIFDIGNIFFFFYENNIDIGYKGIIIATLFLSPTTSIAFLIGLVFFAGLALVNRKLLGLLPTRYVNRKSVSRFILPNIFILFFYRSISLETLDINLADI